MALAVSGCSGFERPKPRALPARHQLPGHVGFDVGPPRAAPGRQARVGHVHRLPRGRPDRRARGRCLAFIWDQRNPQSHGHGFMQLSPDGQHLEGRWGYMKDDIEGGRWAADRESSVASDPRQCFEQSREDGLRRPSWHLPSGCTSRSSPSSGVDRRWAVRARRSSVHLELFGESRHRDRVGDEHAREREALSRSMARPDSTGWTIAA